MCVWIYPGEELCTLYFHAENKAVSFIREVFVVTFCVEYVSFHTNTPEMTFPRKAKQKFAKRRLFHGVDINRVTFSFCLQ